MQDIEKLEKAISDLEDILANPKRIKQIIIFELKEVIKKYAKPRKTEIIYDSDIEEEKEEDDIPDYPVHIFFSREGYFKKITPQSLRMSNSNKLKDGDEIIQTAETTNSVEILFFTNKCQVYKTRAANFEDSKASSLGDYVAAKLEMEEGEVPVYMALTSDYSGYMLFFFENGKVAKVSMSSYQTITKRKKLIKAYSDKAPIVDILYIKEDCDLVITSTAGRHLLVNTGAISTKTTKDTAGVNVMTLKKYHTVQGVRFYKEGEFVKPHRYKTKTLPAAGALLSADDTAEQLSLE